MTSTSAADALADARDPIGIFRLVKDVVRRGLRRERAGLMLGLSRLGLSASGFLGGYFVVGSNAIVLNRDVLDWVGLKHPHHHGPYVFHVLLHEYLHALGYLDEGEVRALALRLSRDALGDEHVATRIAHAMTGSAEEGLPEFFRSLVFPPAGHLAARGGMEIVKGFDPDATPYIA